jgi:hypothetical protein
MKKKSLFSKSLILAILLFVGLVPVMAQISEGEPYSRTIRTGNRPAYGDWGIFIGPSFSEITQMLDKDISWRGLPLVNIKYYKDDNMELRLGLQLSKTKDKVKGDLMEGDNKDVPVKYVNGESYYRLTPGFAYHFSSKNLLDVYVGANLPIGLSSERNVNEYDGEPVMFAVNVDGVDCGDFTELFLSLTDDDCEIINHFGSMFPKAITHDKPKYFLGGRVY